MTEERKRGQRGPDRKPRRKRIVVDPARSIVEQAADLRPDPVDVTKHELLSKSRPARKRKRVLRKHFQAQIKVAIFDALEELIDEWETERTYVLELALTWALTTYGPDIAQRHGVRMPPPNPFMTRAAQPLPDTTQPGMSVERFLDSVLPPQDALVPSGAIVATTANGAPKRL